MKAIYLMAFFIFISATASAQSKISVIQLSKAPTAKLIGHSKFGKVYTLPQDHMPCFVPQISLVTAIPTLKSGFRNPVMPNTYAIQEITPQKIDYSIKWFNKFPESQINQTWEVLRPVFEQKKSTRILSTFSLLKGPSQYKVK